MISSRYIASIAAAAFALSASAQDFFSTAPAEKIIQIGVRAGLNTSTQSIDRDLFPNWVSSGWGTGFEVGVDVPLGILDFLSVQPGFYYQLRSGDYAVSPSQQSAQMGHYSMSYVSVPVLLQINFNLTSRTRWTVEAGPYLSWRFGSRHTSAKVEWPEAADADGFSVGTLAKQKKDYGLKVGTHFLIDYHWYAGLHYQAGMTRVYKDKALGGSNQQWVISLGYNF